MYGASVHCPECQSPEVKNIESPPLVNDAIAASIETTSIKPSVKTSTPQVAHERKSNRNISQIEPSRHHNVFNFAVNLIAELIAYTYQEKKLSLHLDPLELAQFPSGVFLYLFITSAAIAIFLSLALLWCCQQPITEASIT